MYRYVVQRSVNSTLQKLSSKAVAVFIYFDDILSVDVLAFFDWSCDVVTLFKLFIVNFSDLFSTFYKLVCLFKLSDRKCRIYRVYVIF